MMPRNVLGAWQQMAGFLVNFKMMDGLIDGLR